MSKTGWALVALVAAAIMLAIAVWFDAAFLHDAQRRATATFESGTFTLLLSAGAFLIAGSVLLLARLAWSSRSLAVGAVYLVVGTFFALLPWLFTGVAPPWLPEPLFLAVGNVYGAAVGPLNAVVVIGAGMAIGGVAAIVGSRRERTGWSVPR